MNSLYDRYGDRVAFRVVYIQEAHPTDLWQVAANLRDRVLLPSPATADERNQAASACVRKLAIRIPALLDGIDNSVERAYTAWPDRLYLIGAGGRILYKSEPGPFGFSAAALEGHIRRLAP